MSRSLRRRRGFDLWPGFVDALASLLMVLVFVLLMFAIGQFVLSDTLSGRNRAIDALNARVAELARSLSLSEGQRRSLDSRVAELAASLGRSEQERDTLGQALAQANEEAARLAADVEALAALKQQLEADVARLVTDLGARDGELVRQTELSARATAQVELLNRQLAALNEQLGQIQAALDLSRRELDSRDATIADLGRQLNIALAERVSELERYRSEFFGRLRASLGERSDVHVVGDRFVLPTDILFESGSAEPGPEASERLAVLAATVREVTAEIPGSLDWVLRIDGHTDDVPIHTTRFPSNWELSAARAIAIVKALVVEGIPAHRLSANGFGQFQPLEKGTSPEARARNRRIEIQLTNR